MSIVKKGGARGERVSAILRSPAEMERPLLLSMTLRVTFFTPNGFLGLCWIIVFLSAPKTKLLVIHIAIKVTRTAFSVSLITLHWLPACLAIAVK